MRTKTGIMWTILMLDLLLVLADPDPVTSVSSTVAETKAHTEKSTTIMATSANPATTRPTLAAEVTASKSLSVQSTTILHPVSTTTKPSDLAPTANPLSTTPAEELSANSTFGEQPPTNSTEPPTANTTTAEPPPANITTAEPPILKFVTTEPPTGKSTATLKKTPAAMPTPIIPATTQPPTEKRGTAHSTTSNATSAPNHPATPSVSSLIPTHRNPASDQASTLRVETPASTAVVATPPASTQPSPDQTTQGQKASSFVNSPEAELPTFQTTKPAITEPFNETITLKNMQESNKEDSLVQSCQMLLEKLGVNSSCKLSGNKVNGQYKFTSASVEVDPVVIQGIYDNISMPPTDPTPVPHTLIAILSSCGALVLILVIFALYCTYHHRSYRKNQQHLTEELQTVENGYHDNPTLEVMEVQPEMQEKKMALNGEFNDSWIVPFDNLAKEEIPDEEDTHL